MKTKTTTTTTVKIERIDGFEAATLGLEAFTFADSRSLPNAMHALLLARLKREKPSLRVPMIVIIGPMGTGKTKLVEMITEAEGSLDGSHARSLTEALTDVCRYNIPFLVFDDAKPAIARSQVLARFLTSDRWRYRKAGNPESWQDRKINTMVIMAGDTGLQLSPELARRSLVIELAIEKPAKK